MTRASSFLTVTLVFGFTASGWAANIPIPNFSFEDPDLADGTDNRQHPNLGGTNIPGWSTTTTVTFASNPPHIGVWDQSSPATGVTGDQVVRLFIPQQDTGWVKLTGPILDQATSGVEYTLSVDIAGTGSTFNSGGPNSELQLWIGGSKQATTIIPATSTDGVFTPYFFSYTAVPVDDGQDIFVQLFMQHNGSSPMRVDIDNFQLSDDTVAEVIPEPGTLWLVGMGLFGLVGPWWRRRRS